ncbi:MAG: 2-keto-4-pentenoate hydratase [Alphaproteobacteria bacterium CG_4_9_14_3_um_filter_47_13]|nr:MAG: 2-keto-4-pentenoate hydratase [Alphaproteobacteria bacterium CG_4_9_14_3_um_filter_47_13]
MKLASLKKARDGQLVVVDNALEHYVPVTVVDTMQQALENWEKVAPELQKISDLLNDGNMSDAQPFNAQNCASPLPRAYQILDGSAYLNHVELVRKARGAEMPPEFLHDPLMYQAVSDTILSPTEDIPVPSEAFGIDYEAEVAVIVDDVPMGVTAEEAGQHIKLVMLMNDVSLRNLIPAELGKGFGFVQSKPPSAFSPVAVTPDTLGTHWKNGKLHLPLLSLYNGKELGHPDAGADMQFDFTQLIAHAAKTRPLSAGTIIGSGTISNYDRSAGVSCFAEIRMIEKIEQGDFKTPFMKYGDTIRIEMNNPSGQSVFGVIEQKIVPYSGSVGQDREKDQSRAIG